MERICENSTLKTIINNSTLNLCSSAERALQSEIVALKYLRTKLATWEASISCREPVLKTFPAIMSASASMKGWTRVEASVGKAHRGLTLECNNPVSLT